MKLGSKEQAVIADIVRRLKSEFGAQRVTLYGSAARGTMDAESDIDLIAVLPVADWETKKRVADLCFEAEMEIERIVSVLCVSRDTVERTPFRSSPLLQAVRREGVPQ